MCEETACFFRGANGPRVCVCVCDCVLRNDMGVRNVCPVSPGPNGGGTVCVSCAATEGVGVVLVFLHFVTGTGHASWALFARCKRMVGLGFFLSSAIGQGNSRRFLTPERQRAFGLCACVCHNVKGRMGGSPRRQRAGRLRFFFPHSTKGGLGGWGGRSGPDPQRQRALKT